MTARAGAVAVPKEHSRPSGAKWRRALSLRARLLLLVALAVGVIVVGLTWLQVHATARSIEQRLIEEAQRTAEAIADDAADDLQNQPEVAYDDLRSRLHEFIEANPALRAVSVVSANGPDETVVASTSTEVRTEAIAAARRAIDSGRVSIERGELLTTVAVPVAGAKPPTGIVTIVSMEASRQARSQGRATALLFAIPVILLVTGLVDALVRQLVHKPVTSIRRTMQSAAAGRLSDRVPVARRDELGTVAEGLNDLLARVEHFNDALQERVREATTELRLRNRELEESYQRVLSLNEALAHAERVAALGQMAASVAHQIGTPLNLVSGYVQMIREDPTVSREVQARLEIVDRQIQQVTRVLRTILDDVRQPSARQPIDIGRVVERAVETARPRLERSGIRLHVSVDAPLEPIQGDAAQLEMALLNLLSNSLDAMPQGGEIFVTVRRAGGNVRLGVRDTGPGIPADVLPRVFDAWVTTKPVGHGSGLGLSIARDVARSHGGTAGAANVTEGGASVWIDLPASAAHPGDERH